MARTDNLTLELPGVKRPPGRPSSGKAKTGAQRQKAYRQRHAIVPAGDLIPATIKALADQFGLTIPQVTRELLRFALCNKNWKRDGFPGCIK